MAGIELAGGEIRALLTHLVRWLSNLRRAGDPRKRESIAALREVILVARRTSVYLKGGGRGSSVPTEQDLAERWTKLGFRLKDLGLGKLAKRCEVSGRHWADPDAHDEEFLRRADIDLGSIERLARRTLDELGA